MQLGFLVISPEMAHISIPIEISPIAEQIQDVYDYANELSDISFRLGNDSQGGLLVKALSYTADQKLKLLSSKFETIVYFLTKQESYDASSVSDMIQKRSIPFDHILPKHAIKVPSFSRDTLAVLHDGFYRPPRQHQYKQKSLETPDDQEQSRVESEVSRSQAFWKWWLATTTPGPTTSTQMARVSTTAGPNTTSTTTTMASTTTNTTMASTTSTTGVPDSWVRIHDLYHGVDMSNDTENTSPAGNTEPLDLDPYQHFTDSFFQETSYPELYEFDDNIVKRSVPSHEAPDSTANNQNLNNPHPIVKRQILMPVIVSLLASIGVSSIFSGVSAAQIDSIKSQESNLEANQKMILHQTESNSRGILVNRNMVDSLGNLTLKLAHFTKQNHFENSGLLLFALMTSELDRVEESLDTYIAIIQSVNEGKFHPAILSQEAGIAAFESVAAAAELRGMKPIINKPQQMAQLQTHFSYTPRGVKVIIKLPLVSRHNSFELYQFNALPIPIGTAAYLYLVSNVPLIAVGEADPTGKATFVELTNENLSQCQQLGKVYICDQQTIVRKSSAESCIYALYLSDHRTADGLCKSYVEQKDHDIAVAIGGNRFAYYSHTPSTYFLRCQNGSHSQSQQLTGITELEVPEGCSAITPHFILRSRSEIFIDAPPRSFEWSEPALSLLGNRSDLGSLDKVLDAYKKARALPALDPKSIGDMMDKQLPFYSAHPAPLSAIALASFAVLLVLGLIFYIWYQYHSAKQAELRLASPRIKARELLENHERLELLEQLLDQQRQQAAVDQLQLL